MTFKRLYEFSENLRQRPVRVEQDLAPQVINLTAQDRIDFVAVDLDPEISLGHIKQYRESNGVYNADPLWVSSIRWHADLNMCWRRFVCCKELMHVFDTDDERVDTAEKFETLLSELELAPPPEQASPMYISENRTKWMALCVLAPKPARDWAVEQINAGAAPYDVALALRLPEDFINNLVGPRYEPILNTLTG